jgi:hypothetical protein
MPTHSVGQRSIIYDFEMITHGHLGRQKDIELLGVVFFLSIG